MAGTLPITMELPICSSSIDMSTSPLMAFCTSCSVIVTSSISRLNRINSCVSTVFIDSSYRTGNMISAFSMSNIGGIRAEISFASSSNISPQLLPSPPRARGCRLRAVSSSALVSEIAHEIFALSCRPNTSGPSLKGRVRTYSR